MRETRRCSDPPAEVSPGRRSAARAASASAIAPSNTACVLRGSTGVGSTANTLLPFKAAPTCFSAAPSANTSTSVRGARAAAASTAARRFGTARASITSSWARLPLARPSSAASRVSTGRTAACPSSVSPSSSRKSSRVVTAVTSTAGWELALADVCGAASVLRGAVDGALATGRLQQERSSASLRRILPFAQAGARARPKLRSVRAKSRRCRICSL